MPGTNLTREEAATRAALLDVTSYSIDLDLTTGDKTFASTTTVRFTCREPGAETFADLVGRDRPRDHAERRAPRRGLVVPERRIALTGLQAENELVVRADCAYSHSGEGLHRFVDPVDGRVYLYTQFEVPDARRVFTTFEQPDLKSVFTWTVTAPAGWKVVSNSPTPEPEDLGDEKARWSFPESKRMSTYITALIAGEYHEHRDVYDGPYGQIPLGHYCRQALVEHLDVDELLKMTKQGFEFFEEAFDFPYPFEKYDQLYVPEYNAGRDGERRCGHAPRRVPPPEPPGRRVLRVPLLGDPPRDGAHVVRRPGHHEVVGRPLAERVVRRVGVLPRGRREHRVHRGLDRLHQRPQELGAAPGPAPLDPPDRGRQLRPARRRGQLRRHHLRQGRLGPQAAGRVGRARGVPGRPAAVLQGPRLRQLRVRRPAHARWRRRPAASSTPGPRSGCRPAASTPSPAEFELADDGTYASFGVRQSAAGDNPTLRRHRLGIGLYDEVGGRLVRRRTLETDIEGDLTAIDELVGEKQPDLLLLNDGDLTYAKIRLDERSLATVVGGLAAARRLAGAGAVLGRGVGHDPRRRDVGDRLRHPGAGQHRDRDRRVRRTGASRTTPRPP